MSSKTGPREGWLTIFLFFAMLMSIAWSIQAAEWTDGLGILQTMILFGGLLGIILAKSRTPNYLSHMLSVLAGSSLAVFLTARVLAHVSTDPVQIAVGDLERQLVDWFVRLFTGQTSAGNYIFLLMLAGLMWLLAYVCAWAIFRWQQVWWAVIICGASLLLNVTYAPTPMTGYVIGFLMSGLLLVVRAHLAIREQEWEGARISFDTDLSYGFMRAGLIISVVAIVLAWAAPSALASRPIQKVWDRIGEPWRRLQDQSSRMFSNLNYRNQPAFVSFGTSTRFGGAVNLSDRPVMDVRSIYARDWRVMVFQEYTSSGWINTDQQTVSVDPGQQDLADPNFAMRMNITQTVIMREPVPAGGAIAAAGQPLKAGLPLTARVSYLSPADIGVPGSSTTSVEGSSAAPRTGGKAPQPTATPSAPRTPAVPGDPSSLYTKAAIKAGDSYQVVSSITLVDEESLRAAGTDYPSWIVPRYLQLPDTLPARVRRLAAQITEGRNSPYDKAQAIEAYLRTIPYNQKIAGPQPGQDGVDYFLFDAKQGYCDYYASAMVVMLRSLGIPARYVQGYAGGEYDNGVFHVLESDAHAWPEVYFPGYGWIEFEPTASQPAILRPRSSTVAPLRATPQAEDAERLGRNAGLFDRPPSVPLPTTTPEPLVLRIGRVVGLVLAIPAVPLLIVAFLLWRRRRQMGGYSRAETVYDDLVLWVRYLFRMSPLDHQTPYEYAVAVNDTLQERHPSVERVAGYYVQERFGGHAADEEEVLNAWREARPALWRSWVEQRIAALRRTWQKFAPPPRVDE